MKLKLIFDCRVNSVRPASQDIRHNTVKSSAKVVPTMHHALQKVRGYLRSQSYSSRGTRTEEDDASDDECLQHDISCPLCRIARAYDAYGITFH